MRKILNLSILLTLGLFVMTQAQANKLISNNKPVVIYLVVGQSEPFLNLAVDREAYELKQTCNTNLNANWALIIGSNIANNVKANQSIAIEYCKDGKFGTYTINQQTNLFITQQLQKLENQEKKSLFGSILATPTVNADIFEIVLTEVFEKLFDKNNSDFFIQLKSMADPKAPVTVFNQLNYRSSANRHIEVLKESGQVLTKDFFEELVLGDGATLKISEALLNSGKTISHYQVSKKNNNSTEASPPPAPHTLGNGGHNLGGGSVNLGADGTYIDETTYEEKHQLDMIYGITSEKFVEIFKNFKAKNIHIKVLYQEVMNLSGFEDLSPDFTAAISEQVEFYHRTLKPEGSYTNFSWSQMAPAINNSNALLEKFKAISQ